MTIRSLIESKWPAIRLMALAFLTLYLELALIRLAAAEVLYLGYFSNFILISVFLGIGVGFLLGEKRLSLFPVTPILLLGLLWFIATSDIDATQLRENAGQLFFGHGGGEQRLPLVVSLSLIFLGTVVTFAGIAQETARCFKRFRPLVAYSLDIGGSLLGIIVFTLHSYLRARPFEWFLLVGILFLVLSLHRKWWRPLVTGAAMAAAIVLLIQTQPDTYHRWSPYQRIDVIPFQGGGFHLTANGIGHQTMVPVGWKEEIYDYPYTTLLELTGREAMYENALVLGAGSGTDLSYALHYGVERIDAVEIDPEIQRAGLHLHPAQPYQDEGVTAHINDGRAFMQTAEGPYDLIIFALPDSLASFSNLSNIRLESFLFTRESFEQASRLLADDGVLVLYNYYRQPWLVEKLAQMLGSVFGYEPLLHVYRADLDFYLAALAIGPNARGEPRDAPPMRLAEDDWPFLYMREAEVPPMYLGLIFVFLATGLIGILVSGQMRRTSLLDNGPFLLMGAAFLLLETKSIIQFSLLFGATWVVNSLVFGAILFSVLVANFIVEKLDIKSPTWPFALLAVALVVHIAVPFHALVSIESFMTRYILASLVLFSPIFCANLVFGYLFKDTPKSATAFGWNLIGTMFGAALEYTSLAMGYQWLAVIVALLYAMTAVWAFLLVRGKRAQGGAAA